MNFYIMTWREENDDYPFLGYYPDINSLMFDLKELYQEFKPLDGKSPNDIQNKVLNEKGDSVKTDWMLEDNSSVFITIKKCII